MSSWLRNDHDLVGPIVQSAALWSPRSPDGVTSVRNEIFSGYDRSMIRAKIHRGRRDLAWAREPSNRNIGFRSFTLFTRPTNQCHWRFHHRRRDCVDGYSIPGPFQREHFRKPDKPGFA